MDAITTTAAGGMRSRLESLDILANNMANSGATAFKGDSEFYNLYVSTDAYASGSSNVATEPVIDKHWTNFAQGTLNATQNPLDLALAGSGFFALNSSKGNLYTRDGNFSLSKKSEIQTKEGYLLRNKKDGKAIVIDPTKEIQIATDGTIRQDGIEIGTLELVEFSDPHRLAKQGQNYFKLSSDDIKPNPVVGGQVQQGSLENGNVQPAESAVRLVTVMRQFEMLQKAMTIGADMNKRATDDVARV